MSTIAKSTRTVGELKQLLDGIPDDTPMLVPENVAYPRFTLHFIGGPDNCFQVTVESGEELE